MTSLQRELQNLNIKYQADIHHLEKTNERLEMENRSMRDTLTKITETLQFQSDRSERLEQMLHTLIQQNTTPDGYIPKKRQNTMLTPTKLWTETSETPPGRIATDSPQQNKNE